MSPLSFGYLRYTKALLYDSAADMHHNRNRSLWRVTQCISENCDCLCKLLHFNHVSNTLQISRKCLLSLGNCVKSRAVSETFYRQLDCIGLLSQLCCDFFMKWEYYISLSSSGFNSLCKMEFCCLTVTSNLHIEDLQYILLGSEAETI